MPLTNSPSPQILQGPTKDDIDQQSVSSQKNPWSTQLTFTCSESTIDTLEKGVRYVQT